MEYAAVEPESLRENLPCIWALAGVLDYRLCDLEYRCETCELFHALSRHRVGAGGAAGISDDTSDEGAAVDDALEEQVGAHLSHLLHGCRLYLDRWYSPRHYWLSFERGIEVTLGLHAHIPKILRPIDEITAPQAGTFLNRGAPSGWIARSVVAIPLRTPVAGKVTAVNDGYVAAVRVNGEVPARDDWLLRMEAARPLDMDPGLLRGEKTLAWYLRVIETIGRFLRETVTAGRQLEIGRTLSDGGEPPTDLETVLGRECFARLVNEIL